ncbi:MAG: type II toxin-antitoxin system VapB family antitoxin [Luteolibacter sp.]|uniref:type II toxin-antitoxin system VapB family antitoxin n=1 Tax=Luteolibacter sp. TaxID=1962973 RepID=UPI0032656245
MTMHIDEALLKRVMEEYECETKTEAVEMALREMDRRMRFREIGKKGMGATSEELKAAVDPNYDLESLRVADTPRKYGK